MRSEIPSEVLKSFRPGAAADKVLKFYLELGIGSFGKLEEVARQASCAKSKASARRSNRKSYKAPTFAGRARGSDICIARPPRR